MELSDERVEWWFPVLAMLNIRFPCNIELAS
jgi:hypothetical protein